MDKYAKKIKQWENRKIYTEKDVKRWMKYSSITIFFRRIYLRIKNFGKKETEETKKLAEDFHESFSKLSEQEMVDFVLKCINSTLEEEMDSSECLFTSDN